MQCADGEFQAHSVKQMHVHTVGTEQSLVPVTHVRDENRDQYLKGELEMYYTQWSQEATQAYTYTQNETGP